MEKQRLALRKYLNENKEAVTADFTEIEVPETLTEFREVNNLTKDQLVDWLNENYNQLK